MKIPFRFTRIVSAFAAVAMATVTFAQPPPGGPGGPGGPGPGGPGPGGPGPGPGPRRGLLDVVVPLVVPPPPPPPHYRRRSYSSEAGSSSVSRVQRALKTRGYYSGPVDGDAGSGTRAAIRGFRADNGLAPSSGIDGSLLRALGL